MDGFLFSNYQLSWDEVKEELYEKKHLAQSTVNQLEEWIKISGDVKLIEELLNSKISENSDIRQGLQELQVLVNYCKLLRIEHVLKLDLSLARGLDYYTGVIFEAVLTGDNAKYGSIAAGGRYDNLVGDLTEKVQRHDVPCVGVSIGIERIFSILADESAGAEEEGRIIAERHLNLYQNALCGIRDKLLYFLLVLKTCLTESLHVTRRYNDRDTVVFLFN